MAAKLIPDSVRDVLSYDPETGIFRWKVAQPSGIKAGDIAGGIASNGYRRRYVYNGKSILLAHFHRIMAERADHPIGLPSRLSSEG